MAERPRPRSPAEGEAAAPNLLGVVACFVLSGFAALLYQTAWLRQFSLVFGTSELAVAAVLAAYMAGLAAGAAVAGRYVDRVRRPVLVYGVLEAGIALSALAVPALLSLAGALYAWALGGRPEPPDAATVGQPLFYLAAGFLVLALPTGFMGATLPLLMRHAVRTDRELGPKVALLYASNTAGAVLGALTAGFVLLPALGLRSTVYVGVAVNGLVFAIAAALSRRTAPLSQQAPASGESADALGGWSAAGAAWILPLMLVSGATAFAYEVLWTRMLAHVLGGSIYSFATMLAAFLTGIALGGGLAGKLAASRERAASAFAVSQLAIALLSMGVYAWMGPLLPASRETAQQVLYAIAVMLPATLFIGATFPLAVRILARSERQASAATARVYAWNTTGSIAGAILAAFWMVPALGFEGSIRLAVCTNLGLALWTLAFVARSSWISTGAAALALLGALLAYRPARPEAVVSNTAFAVQQLVDPRETFYAVGRSSTVRMLQQGGFHHLLTNGLPEAAIASRGSPPFRDAQKWLTALPVVARPDTRSMLVIGFGGGITLEGVAPSVRQVDVVELEPEVIRANRTLAGQRGYDPLTDPRVATIINDARNALRLTAKTYDVIVSQPSHPWTAGASHLFTVEFVRSAVAHLAPGGVFVQWMNSEFVTAPLLRSLAATLLAEFPHVRLYHPQAQVLVFLASATPLDVELELIRTGRPLADDAGHYGRLGMGSVEDLLAALVMDERGVKAFARGAPVGSDDDNPMATQSRSGADGLQLPQLHELFAPYDALLDPNGWVHAQLGADVDFAYVARQVIRLGQAPRASALGRAVRSEATRSLIAAEVYASQGDGAKALQALRAAVSAEPADAQARFLLLRALTRERAQEELPSVLAGVQGPALAVVEGWQHAVRGDWRALASLDGALARSRATDVWYTEAARLRALWRIQTDGDRERLAEETLRLLEPALVVSSEDDVFGLYQLRAQAAVAAGDSDVLVESARDIVASVRGNLQRSDSDGVAQLAVMKRSLESMVDELGKDLPAGTRERAAAVRAEARAVANALESRPARP